MKKASLLCIATLLSTAALAGEPSFRKLARQFKSGSQISDSLLTNRILGKTYSCLKQYKDSSATETYVRFETVSDQIVDVMNGHKYELSSNGLVGSRSTINGPAKLEVRSNGSSLIISDSSPSMQSYSKCSSIKESAVQVAAVANEEIISQATDGEFGWVLLTKKSDGEFVVEFKIGDIKETISEQKILSHLNLEAGYSIVSSSKVVHRADSFMLLLELAKEGSGYVNYVVALNGAGELSSTNLVGNSSGVVSVNPEGQIGFVRPDYKAGRGRYLVESFSSEGQITSGFKTEFGLEAVRLQSGYLFASACFHNMNGSVPCPERRRNYFGVTLTNDVGEQIKFISEYDYFETIGNVLAKPVWIQSSEDGGFYVAWENNIDLGTTTVTLFKYSAAGEYQNSWGPDAKNPAHRNIVMLNNFEKDMFTIKGDRAYFSRKNVVFGFKL